MTATEKAKLAGLVAVFAATVAASPPVQWAVARTTEKGQAA